MDIIAQALANNQNTLTEYEAKQFLTSFGIPVSREVLAQDADGAAREAEKLDFPVVLKAAGRGVFHKTDVGGVVLNLRTAEEVREVGERLLKIKGAESLLMAEMVPGDRELVCGLIRDAQYGPCVMFGLGGIMTEVFRDVVFRVAPLTTSDTREMLSEIRAQKILQPFRGQAAADTDALSQILITLGEIGLKHPEIQSIDINPLKVRPDGKPVAVDALINLSARVTHHRSMEFSGQPPHLNPLPHWGEEINSNTALAPHFGEQAKKAGLGKFFTPDSVAVIGASATAGKAGNTVIKNILDNGYKGEIYPVNPKGGEILSLPVTTSISVLPEGIDLAIVMTPAETTPQVVRECAARGIKYFVLAAGGFSEVDKAGDALQKELIKVIEETGVRAIGPNTSGHTSTPHNFTSGFFPLGKIPRGNISYIAQTGNFATHTMRYIATAENYGVARVIGLGNKIDIDETEALEYLADDPETKAIFMYLESIKRPRQFIEVARRVTKLKPVIMLKGGSTGEGSKAAVTHTAAMASDERITDGALAQSGITRVYDYSHLVLAAKAVSFMPLPKGNRVSFLAPSGAMLVVLADLCAQHWGLAVPDLEEATQKRLQEISPAYIRMRNPVDIWPAALQHGIEFAYREGIEALMKDANIDAVVPILMLTDDVGVPPLDFIVDLAKKYPEKPLYVTFSGEKKHVEASKTFLEPKGVPTYPLIEQPFEVLSILWQCRKNMRRYIK